MILILGGARSGKSTFAQNMASEIAPTNKVAYVATSPYSDEDMIHRIKHHQQNRPTQWPTFEQHTSFSELKHSALFMEQKVCLLDCLTLFVSNFLYVEDSDLLSEKRIAEIEEKIMEELKVLIDLCEEQGKELIIVSNEVGLGVVPAFRSGIIFRDIAGRLNQQVAQRAKQVYFIAAGLPLRMK